MTAWVHPGPANSEVEKISRCNVMIPEPQPNEIRVKLAAASVNPVDWKHVYFEASTFPSIFGIDGAGVVDAVGEEVKDFAKGDKVHFLVNLFKEFGTFAEYCVVEAAFAVKIPAGVSFADAAATPCAAWTAYEVLYDRLKIEEGKTIFIAAGAGGVGHFAVQMAGGITKCKVITSASGENVDRLKSEGNCALVIDYKKQNVREEVMKFTGDQGVDYVFDMLGEDEAMESLKMLGYGGQICHISISMPSLPDGGNFSNGISTHHVLLLKNLVSGPKHLNKFLGFANQCDEWLAQGRIKTDVSKIYTVEEIAEALKAQQGGRVRGKALIAYTKDPESIRDPSATV